MDLKSLVLTLLKLGIDAQGFRDDISLFAFLLEAEPSACSLEAMVERRLDLRTGPRADERALFIHELNAMLRPEVERRGLLPLYLEMDLPLAGVLARMEHTGIRVNPDELSRMSGLMDIEIRRLTAEIHTIAGHEFNIASPQQLGKVLFEEMNLPTPVKYGKGKQISTAADVLESAPS